VVGPSDVFEDEATIARLKQWKAGMQQQQSNPLGDGAPLSSLFGRTRGVKDDESQDTSLARDPLRAAYGPMHPSSGKLLSERLGLGASTDKASGTLPTSKKLGLSRSFGSLKDRKSVAGRWW